MEQDEMLEAIYEFRPKLDFDGLKRFVGIILRANAPSKTDGRRHGLGSAGV